MNNIYVLVLGTAQDGGFPQVGCFKKCCKYIDKPRLVSSIAIVNKENNSCWLIDVTPDFKQQIELIKSFLSINFMPKINGIFLTHAHIGHYIGLVNLGTEVLNVKNVPVYAMPRMKFFLENNAPFSFLIKSNNIIVNKIVDGYLELLDSVFIKSFLVPHRNELSETVGYNIKSKYKSVIYIPDIDDWKLWENDILNVVMDNNIIFIDGTFYSSNELGHRDILKIPHPIITDSMKIFSVLDKKDAKKIFFTHLNHTNPILNKNSKERQFVLSEGYNILNDNQVFEI